MRRSLWTLCERAAVTPTASTTWLLRESHEGVGIARCACGKLWLHLGVEIFDDFTNYWAPVTREDAELLRNQASSGGGEELRGLARRMVRERIVLMEGTARTSWIAGEHAMLSGPPW